MKTEFKVGDTIRIKPTGRIVTIKAVTNSYYDLGYDEEGNHLIADLKFPEQYELYKPSLKRRIGHLFGKLNQK